MGTVSVVEILWTAMSIAGIIVCGRGWGMASKVKRRLVESGLNGVRMLAANESIRQERMATLQQVAFLLTGIVAMSNPPNPSSPNWWAPLIIGLALIFAAAAGIYKAVKRQSLQAKLEEIIRTQDQRLTDMENYDTVGMHQL